MTDFILTSTSDRILRIQFNRPDKKNAITLDMYSAMNDAIRLAESDKNIRVIFITGTDNIFTSGNDIKDFVENPPSDDSSPVYLFLQAITDVKKPVVAAVNGIAVGIGTTMLLHFDLVYASENARFHLPFVNLGLVPEAGSSYLLPRVAGHRKAAELLLFGEPFNAETALEAGIINGIYKEKELEQAAWQKARILSEKPPEALRLTRSLLRRGVLKSVKDAMAEEGTHFSSSLKSPEANEAFKAFMERRKPDFSKF